MYCQKANLVIENFYSEATNCVLMYLTDKICPDLSETVPDLVNCPDTIIKSISFVFKSVPI